MENVSMSGENEKNYTFLDNLFSKFCKTARKFTKTLEIFSYPNSVIHVKSQNPLYRNIVKQNHSKKNFSLKSIQLLAPSITA